MNGKAAIFVRQENLDNNYSSLASFLTENIPRNWGWIVGIIFYILNIILKLNKNHKKPSY